MSLEINEAGQFIFTSFAETGEIYFTNDLGEQGYSITSTVGALTLIATQVDANIQLNWSV